MTLAFHNYNHAEDISASSLRDEPDLQTERYVIPAHRRAAVDTVRSTAGSSYSPSTWVRAIYADHDPHRLGLYNKIELVVHLDS